MNLTRTIAGIVAISCVCQASPVVGGPIHLAARAGDIETVSTLLATDGELLDAPDDIGLTPLTLAAAYGHWDLFRFLLDAGADVNATARTGTTPLHAVCYHDEPSMVELLFSYGGDSSITGRDVYGAYTPLLRAVQSCAGNTAVFLLKNGARPDETTREGWNALHLAAICGHRNLYGTLIEAGVSLDAVDRIGRTPMCYDRPRPSPISSDKDLLDEYIGHYHWQGDKEAPGVDIFVKDGRLILDDNCLNIMDPIARDTFYCRRNPWRARFIRGTDGSVDQVELVFLRQTVVLDKIRD
jgi:hypothetical protein